MSGAFHSENDAGTHDMKNGKVPWYGHIMIL